MCTVSYIPTSEGFIITSNRDESTIRGSAIPPIVEIYGEYQLAYPKDPKSGGTWFVINNKFEAAVLLNGAFEDHIKLPAYRKSRGIILLEIMRSKSPEKTFEKINLSGIENFTLLLFKKSSLIEYRWDGIQKFKESKNTRQAHIWSSATLYPHPIKKLREDWFTNWISKELKIDQQKAMSFHRTAGIGDKENDLVMQRSNHISTLSITSINFNSTTATMLYEDLNNVSSV